MNQLIQIENLKLSFNGNPVLKGITLNVNKGENLVVIGKSGGGKSVMIQCIVGLLTPDEGSVKVFDKEVSNLNEEELKNLRIRIGFLFQQAALYDSMTIRENLSFPLTRVLRIKNQKEITRRSEEALDAVGLSDAMNKMPSDLSGGQRKRMGIARTLIVNPEIILYDEPTTGLDTITSKEISQLILDVRDQYKSTAIIITHDMSCAKITADRIVVLNEGKLIAAGSYGALNNAENPFISSFFKY